jgi:6-phosphogluconolactonase
MVKEFLFADRPALFSSLAQACQQHLKNELQSNETTSLMVSGGSTPAPLYKALSHAELDWGKITVALVDERWVDRTHKASNEDLIYRSLLINYARSATFISMKTKAATAIEGCGKTEALYSRLPKPFAMSILGMGSDGHTASLFPHADGLVEALNADNDHLTAPIMARQSDVTGPNTERITLTLNGLLQSRRLIILLTGDEKLDVFRTAMSDLSDSALYDMPIRAVLRQNSVPIELYWAP